MIVLFCKVCGEKLEVKEMRWNRGRLGICVEPCLKCLLQAKEEGREEAGNMTKWTKEIIKQAQKECGHDCPFSKIEDELEQAGHELDNEINEIRTRG